MSAPDAPMRLALLAHPAGHSVSPAMHRAAFAALGLDARYDAFDVPPADLGAAVARLRAAPWAGANVTVPHKEAVIRFLDELTPVARRLGAVNTIMRRGGALLGDNTDLAGFARSLAGLRPAWGDVPVVVVGAGGAARAVVAAFVDVGARVALWARDAGRARALLDELAPGAAEVLSDTARDAAVAACAALVQTTPVGMHGGPAGSPLAAGVLPAGGAVIDLIYRPPRTPLLRAAQAAGLRVRNGLPMLVYQGAASLEAWTGRAAPIHVMGVAAEAALGGPGRGWTGLGGDEAEG